MLINRIPLLLAKVALVAVLVLGFSASTAPEASAQSSSFCSWRWSAYNVAPNGTHVWSQSCRTSAGQDVYQCNHFWHPTYGTNGVCYVISNLHIYAQW